MRLFTHFARLAPALLTAGFLTGCSTPSAPPAPLASATPQTQSPTASGKREIAALFERWNASLATLDPEKVVANYTPDAVLLPTLSNQPRTNHAGLRDYFVAFLAKKPQGKIDSRTIRLEGSTAWDVGIYTFTLRGGDGKPVKVQARYTFVYERQPAGGWLIAHHHSSQMPEPVAPPR